MLEKSRPPRKRSAGSKARSNSNTEGSPGTAEILAELERLGDPANVEGMARYGIVSTCAFGVAAPDIRALAKKVGRNQALAEEVWKTGIHDARVLACFLSEPKVMSARTMDAWIRDFDNWAVCDAACFHAFDRTPHAYAKAREWTHRTAEFERRAGFALMASLAVHDKKAPDEAFLPFLEDIRAAADDSRNFVKKAVNWALRQIGKRKSETLAAKAMELARELKSSGVAAARWIGSDAVREFEKRAMIESR